MDRDPSRRTEIFYVTDAGFATPTIASIVSLRRWPSAKSVKINILLLGLSDAAAAAFANISDDLNVSIKHLSLDALAAFNNDKFQKTHVPTTTLARFLIPEFVDQPDSCDILYVDGDTWFMQDPAALMDVAAPEQGLLAAEDQSFFYQHDHFGYTGKQTRSYFEDIGVKRANGYFNAGLLKCRANNWAEISLLCLSFLRQNLHLCQFHDQSALNAVVGDRRKRLSPAWNFQTPYWGWGAADIVTPRLLHFLGGGKPWMGQTKAWQTIFVDYSRVIDCRSSSEFPVKRWSAEEQLQVTQIERMAQLKNRTIFAHRILRRRQLFKQLVKTSVM